MWHIIITSLPQMIASDHRIHIWIDISSPNSIN